MTAQRIGTQVQPLTQKGDILGYGSGTVARVPVGADGSHLLADSTSATGVSYQPQFVAGKNRIINGDFGVWQRGTSFNATSGQFFADRWQFSTDANPTTQTVTQQTFTPGTAPVAGYEGTYFLRSTITTPGSSTVSEFLQKVEDVRLFANQTATLSFWAKGDSSRSAIINISQGFGSGGSGTVGVSSSSFNYTTSWQRFTFTLAFPSISGKTIGTGSALNIAIRQAVAAGSVFDIWGVQLEAGSVATPFTTATGTVQGELAACQRYYWRNTVNAAYGPLSLVNGASSTTTVYAPVQFPVTMRIAPTSLEYPTSYTGVSVGDGTNRTAVTALALDSASVNSTNVQATVASGLTQYRPSYVQANNSATAFLGFSAEL